MFLSFSDWTTIDNLAKLEKQGFPHAKKLIKVFAFPKNPSEELKRNIKVFEQRGDLQFEPNDRFKWYNRGPWSGTDMELFLKSFHLPEEANQQIRALFRFANSDEMKIVELAMSPKNTIRHYGHPLDIIDGIEEAQTRQRYHGLHLDIFSPPSIEHLGKLVDLENPEGLLTIRESVRLTGLNPEGSPATKESQ